MLILRNAQGQCLVLSSVNDATLMVQRSVCTVMDRRQNCSSEAQSRGDKHNPELTLFFKDG